MAAGGAGPSRERILALLRHGPQTVEELAGAIDLTTNGVRAQLAALERDGLVHREKIRYREGAGAGKPPWTYAITPAAEAGFSRAYVPVLTALAGTLSEELEGEELGKLFERVGSRLAVALPYDPNETPATMAKLVLESLGAAVTIRYGGPSAIVEGAACPIAATVSRCPESCEMVRSMLASTTGAEVVTRCVHGEAPRCRFAVA